MSGAEGAAVDKCEVCGWTEEFGLSTGFSHFVWSTVRKSIRADSYIEVLERGEQHTGELEYVRGRYQVALSHEAAVGGAA